jgi:[calcium/calmodulin-dependent protein kinase] kinase
MTAREGKRPRVVRQVTNKPGFVRQATDEFVDEDAVETDEVHVTLDEDGEVTAVNGYKFVKELGSGAYATVYLCEKDTPEGKLLFAAKEFKKSILKRQRDFKRENGKMVVHTALEKVHTEIAVMKSLHHRNLVHLFEVIDEEDADKLYLILENVRYGQIMDWHDDIRKYVAINTEGGDGAIVLRNGSNVITEQAARSYMKEIIDGLHYMHCNAICHRDIKPDNILLGRGKHIKIADFGVSHFFGDEDAMHKHQMSNTEGTYHFLSPEAVAGGKYDTYKADIWALGVTLYCFVCGDTPFWCDEGGITAVMEAIQNKEVTFPDYLSAELKSLLSAMLLKDPTARSTLDGIMGHEWMHQGGHNLSLNVHDIHTVDKNDLQSAITPRKSNVGGGSSTHADLKVVGLGSIENRLNGLSGGSEDDQAELPPGPCANCIVC